MIEKINILRKYPGKWIWFFLIVIVIGGGIFFFRSRSKKEPEVAKVERGQVKQELILTGSVNAEKYAALMFPTSGKISWISAKEGQEIKKGQAITALDTTVLNSAYQQALNNYRNYQAAAESALDSVKNHSSDETFTQKATRTAAEVARDNAYDAMIAAKYNLNNSVILAPFKGIISSLPFTSPGVNVSLTDVQVIIIDPATVYFDVNADQSEVISIKEGQRVTVVLDSFQERSIVGRVAFIGYTPKAGEAGAVYKVKIVFEEKPGDIPLRVGMTGDVKFVLEEKENVLFAPPKFVNADKDGKFVYLGKPGKKQRVEIGLEGEDGVEIVSGVKEGDTLYD